MQSSVKRRFSSFYGPHTRTKSIDRRTTKGSLLESSTDGPFVVCLWPFVCLHCAIPSGPKNRFHFSSSLAGFHPVLLHHAQITAHNNRIASFMLHISSLYEWEKTLKREWRDRGHWVEPKGKIKVLESVSAGSMGELDGVFPSLPRICMFVETDWKKKGKQKNRGPTQQSSGYTRSGCVYRRLRLRKRNK